MLLSFIRHPLIKAVLLQVHSVVGLTIGLVVALMGLTGALMAFEDEIQAKLNAGMTHVEIRAAPRLTPDELIARLQSSGLGKVSAITMASDPSSSVRIRFARNEDSSRPSSIYADPYDGRVIGAPSGESFFATVRKLHRWLLLPGDGNGYGRPITGIAALGLVAMLITGLILRWPHRVRNIKTWLKPNLGLRGRGLHRSLHSVIATWVLPIYLVITLTGLLWSFDWYKDAADWLLASSSVKPAMQPKAPRVAGASKSEKPETKSDAPQLALDPAWSAFLQTQSRRFATAQLTLPTGNGTTVRIRSWAPDANDGARDEFRIDAATGKIVSSEIYGDKTLGERVLALKLDIHRGSILGWPGKLAFMLAASLMPFFLVTGILLYLSRRRHRRLLLAAQRLSGPQ